jgi:hypothetical protein
LPLRFFGEFGKCAGFGHPNQRLRIAAWAVREPNHIGINELLASPEADLGALPVTYQGELSVSRGGSFWEVRQVRV